MNRHPAPQSGGRDGDETNGWRRLGAAVVGRRRSLGLSQAELRQAGGPSTDTLRKIEGGLAAQCDPRTLRKLETALHWEPGSVAAVLDGGDPCPATARSRAADWLLSLRDVHGTFTDAERRQIERVALAAAWDTAWRIRTGDPNQVAGFS